MLEKAVEIIQDIPEIKLVERKVGPFTKGEEAWVKSWEASIFEDRGLAKLKDDLSVVGLRKKLMREQRDSELRELPSNFYLTVSQRLEKLREKGDLEKVEEINDIINSLVSLRIQKIAKISLSSGSLDNVSNRESFLVNRLNQAKTIWRRRLDRLLKKPHNEEVGAHERENRRSIQGVVKNTTDIQE